MSAEHSHSETDFRHKIVIKGKYLAAIESYVSTLVFDSSSPVKWNSQMEALQDVIVKLGGRYLDKDNAASIVVDQCLRFRREHQDRTGSLSETSNADLRSQLVERIKQFIESLPKTYSLRVGLPAFQQWEVGSFKISDDLQLVFSSKQEFVINALAGLLNNVVSSVPTNKFIGLPTEQMCFVEFFTDGYTEGSPDSPAVSNCLSSAKQFAFILTTHGVCKTEYRSLKASAVLIDRNSGERFSLALPDSIARCFGQLTLNEEKLLVYDKGNTLLTKGQGRPANSPQEKIVALKDALHPIIRFHQSRSHPDFQSVAAAIEWYQDSKFADNQTFAYIAACIGLEALLGSDSHLDSMSKRLADRYAFLLGRSRVEREEMIVDYTKVLNLRGRLVHSKVARLSNEDRNLLYIAQKMLLNAIWHELYAMYRSKDAYQA